MQIRLGGSHLRLAGGAEIKPAVACVVLLLLLLLRGQAQQARGDKPNTHTHTQSVPLTGRKTGLF